MARHRFHGDPARFDAVADFVAERFGRSVRWVADVAGGQGMLARQLAKRHGYDAEVVDPRGWTLVGVPARADEFSSDMADYYDLVVGLHPDEALPETVRAGLRRPAVIVPCCNFWSDERLGTVALLDALETFYDERGVPVERVTLAFRGPKNVALVTTPRARFGPS